MPNYAVASNTRCEDFEYDISSAQLPSYGRSH
jgi:hypothetical protein